jgi:hypothetical protein
VDEDNMELKTYIMNSEKKDKGKAIKYILKKKKH